MKTIHTLAIAVIVALGVGALPVQAEDTVAVNEVLRLKNAGVSEETIVIFVRSQSKNYDLTAERIIVLREQGVSSAVIHAMLESGKNTGALPPAPELPTPPTVSLTALDQDVAYFHQELSPYGRWILSEENQWYWQPTVAVDNSNWRPYWDQGSWVYTDHGWYWSSDYPWGWAAFHYGRWNLHPHHGWIWYPDREWAPAWVTWRVGGDYCGWAPLPQYSHYDYAGGGLSYHGSHVEASFGFGLDWNQFNFSYLRDMGERPRARFRKEADARKMYNQTTVINNYSVSKTIINNETHPRLINQGIDLDRVTIAKGKPVETVRIQDRRMPSPSRVPERVDTRAKTLDVYRPRLAEPKNPLRIPPVAVPPSRPSVPPAQAEHGKVLPPKTHSAPEVPATSQRNVTPPPRLPQESRPSAPPPKAEPRKTPPAAPQAPPSKPASPPRSLPGKPQEDAK